MHCRTLLLALTFLTGPTGRNLRAGEDPSVKVFILAGQSNMEGKAKVALLDYQVKQEATRPLFAHFEKDGKWQERDDVLIKFLDRRGPLTVGYGSPGCIGPELQFGWTAGDHFREPVLLVKTAWGGRSLWRDFRPPSAGMPPDAVLTKMLEEARKKKPGTTMDEIRAPFGASYRDMVNEVKAVLADPGPLFPALQHHRPELAGMMWFQGWNDMINPDYTVEYAENLAHFIRDLRRDLQAPGLPVAVAQMGVDGLNANEGIQRFKAAQAAGVDREEFKGTVALVKTDLFWDTGAEAVFKKGWREHLDEWNGVGSDWGFHYYGSAKTLCAIGKACAEALLAMQPKR